MCTDTCVGKTFVASALARSWTASGRRVRVLKPLASGAEPRDGGFDVHVLNDRVDALGFMVVTDWEFLDGRAYAVVERRSGG